MPEHMAMTDVANALVGGNCSQTLVDGRFRPPLARWE